MGLYLAGILALTAFKGLWITGLIICTILLSRLKKGQEWSPKARIAFFGSIAVDTAGLLVMAAFLAYTISSFHTPSVDSDPHISAYIARTHSSVVQKIIIWTMILGIVPLVKYVCYRLFRQGKTPLSEENLPIEKQGTNYSGFLRRGMAFLIDMAAAVLGAMTLAGLIGLAIPLDGSMGGFAISGSLLAGFIYFLTAPALVGNSFGKFVTGIKISLQNGDSPGLGRCILRGIPLVIWPLEALITLFSKKRIGDRLAGTSVILDPENSLSFFKKSAALALVLGSLYGFSILTLGIASKKTGVYKAAVNQVYVDIGRGLLDEYYGRPVKLAWLPRRVEIKHDFATVILSILGSKKSGFIKFSLVRLGEWGVAEIEPLQDAGPRSYSFNISSVKIPSLKRPQTEKVEPIPDPSLEARGANGRTPLMSAALENRIELIISLLKQGALIDAEDEDGATPLMLAAMNGHKNAVLNLQIKGADLNHKAKSGTTAIDQAALGGHYETVEALYRYGADINSRANDLWTPLMSAASQGHTKVVRLLLECGADFELLNNKNMTAEDLARAKNHKDTADLIASYKKRPKEKAIDGPGLKHK